MESPNNFPDPEGSFLLWIRAEERRDFWTPLRQALGLPPEALKRILSPGGELASLPGENSGAFRQASTMDEAETLLDDRKLSGSCALVELAPPWLDVAPPDRLDVFLYRAWRCAVQFWAYHCIVTVEPEALGRLLTHPMVTECDFWDGIILSSGGKVRTFCRGNPLPIPEEEQEAGDEWEYVPRCQYCGAEVSQEELEYFRDLSGAPALECCPQCFERHVAGTHGKTAARENVRIL